MLDAFDYLLYCARCCSTLFDGDQKCWENNQTFLLFEVLLCADRLNVEFVWPIWFYRSIEHARFVHAHFTQLRKRGPRNNLNTKQASCLHHRGHETLEMLEGMLCVFDHPEQSSIEQGRAEASKVVRCSVNCWIRTTVCLPTRVLLQNHLI